MGLCIVSNEYLKIHATTIRIFIVAKYRYSLGDYSLPTWPYRHIQKTARSGIKERSFSKLWIVQQLQVQI